VDRITDGVST
jgi:Ras family